MPEAEGLAYVVLHGGGAAAGAVDCPVCHTRNSVGYSWVHHSNGWLRWRAACSYCEFIEVGRQYRPVEPVMVISQAINEEAAMGITEGDLRREVTDPVLEPNYCVCCGTEVPHVYVRFCDDCWEHTEDDTAEEGHRWGP